VEIFSLETSPEFMSLPLEIQGFCAVTLVDRDGLLLPGNPDVGVLKYQGMHFVVSSRETQEQFVRDPAKYANGILEVAARRPELVHLLQLTDHFPGAQLPGEQGSNVHAAGMGARASAAGGGRTGSGGRPGMVDAATETPVHFIEKHIDPKYHWNAWELRRRALRIASLKNARTMSTQTQVSHYRREAETQVYLPRTKGTNTVASKGTTTKRTVRYVTGLRGAGLPSKPTTLTADAAAAKEPPSAGDGRATVGGADGMVVEAVSNKTEAATITMEIDPETWHGQVHVISPRR
jgi:hypothetical protein